MMAWGNRSREESQACMRPLDDNGLLGEGLKGVEGSKLTLRERVYLLVEDLQVVGG